MGDTASAPRRGGGAWTILVYVGAALNVLIFPILIFYVLIVAKLIPIRPWQRLVDRGMLWTSYKWTGWNARILGAFGNFRVHATLPPGLELRRDKRYLLLANHQSFTDIFVLHNTFLPKTPFLTFFMKQELFYMPVFGLVWWSLGFPFMKRYPASYLEKHPEKRFQDIETTKKFCSRIRGKPYAIINFVEGTRRTPSKAKKSPYKHLLGPKAGGVATALQALDYEFDYILDVTIEYAAPRIGMGDMMAGRIGDVTVNVREIPLADVPRGDYFRDPEFAERFRSWLNQVWAAKDQRFSVGYVTPEARREADGL